MMGFYTEDAITGDLILIGLRPGGFIPCTIAYFLITITRCHKDNSRY
ncbi:hypothetical protein J7M23_09510 [Candidatus Sumerlaeota bacterium]|nr:hypothetical protein [Candidatus Sumerlaeota bacterium]